ncbi:pentapeptide repeat-containing protein [Streptomyces solicathayae]|uniref:Pentapeptide repeat-containing protein n=1 Tax=Streptomyces solicathayae TaxID=3081768 RepID=A0ABZ0LTG0_9ACTN|nr:pentapeptide repeat-containing protein [Streptomyces sp. HUAS YS2]WOX22729.1 pentapeptide repeat-containing protein [Streptomyces sp. HUAS YS2]
MVGQSLDEATPPDDSSSEFAALNKANDKIREAAKWMIASSAAVGAALLAGSQLSNIGKLEWSWRLGVAIGGAVVGLAAVVAAIWLAVRLLVPVVVTIDQLAREWEHPTDSVKAAVEFFNATPSQLGIWDTPQSLMDDLAQTEARRDAAAKKRKRAEVRQEEDRIGQIEVWIESIQQVAQNRVLEARFKGTLKLLLLATSLAAVGIVAFAWASNPPPKPPPSASLENSSLLNADLRDADLRGANLDEADLTGADLTGADLTGASIAGVKWKNTTCPDGRNSDRVGGTCAGHLNPE